MTQTDAASNEPVDPNGAIVPVQDPYADDPFLNPNKKVPTTYTQSRFDHDVVEFCRTEPFLGTILSQITRDLDYDSPAAGYIAPRKFGKMWTFYTAFDPWRMQVISSKERMGIFEHELYHLILGHLTTRAGISAQNRRLYNVAMDLAINSLINDQPNQRNTDSKGHLPRQYSLIPGLVPKGCKTPMEEEFFRTLPKLQSAEVYFQLLTRFQEQQQKQKGEGEGEEDSEYVVFSGVRGFDDHETWDQLPEEVQDLLRQKMRGLMENGMRKSDQSNNWGSVPQWMIEAIRKMLSGEIDWRAVLRWFLGSARSPQRDSTVKRINKRMPYIFPGAKRQVQKDFVCFIDQSGSMGDDDIALLFAELSNLANFSEIDLYHFDTEVDDASHQIWNRTCSYPKALRTRCGGTDFNAVASFINAKATRNKKWSGVIILTDGYAPTMGHIAAGKVLWVITPGGNMDSVRPGDLVIKMTKDNTSKGAEVKL